MAAERLRLMRHAVVNNLAAPASAVIGILLVPVMLGALGQDNYSLWIIATSLAGIVAASDLGLYWGICRVVAADPEGREADHAAFVNSAGNIYAGIGLLGGMVLGLAGISAGRRLHLPPEAEGVAPQVFWLVGVSIFMERLGAFGSAVLAGLRRFGLINLVAGSVSVLWAAGVIVVLGSGGAVPAVAGWLLATALAKGGVTLLLVARLAPRYQYRPGPVRWQAVRHHVSFALSSLLVDSLGRLAWNCGPVLLGFFRGPDAAVPFYIAQKIPVAVSGMSWRAAEVIFPAASESMNDGVTTRDTVRVGSRWVLALALPFAVLSFVAAPAILKAWIGSPPPGAVAILRILAVLAVLDAMAVGPLHVLWGRGAINAVLGTRVGQGLGVVALTVVLTSFMGAVGAALGLLLPVSAAAIIYFVAASRLCGLPVRDLMADTWRGLTLPAGVCAAGAALLLQFKGPARMWVIGVLAASLLAYAAILFGVSGNADEKHFARDALSPIVRLFGRAST